MAVTCDYFLMCSNVPEGLVSNPAPGDVPTCRRCAAHVGVELHPFPENG